MANHRNERKELASQGSELRLKYGHIENVIVLAIVALITLDGFACIIYGQSCGQMIVIAVLSFVGGWGAKSFGAALTVTFLSQPHHSPRV